ncbi:MAG: aspartate--tRNA ligase, partial [Oscillospiraceae bacterium]
MADSMKGLKRSHYCNNVSLKDVDNEVVVCGFVQKQRDKGNLIFIDLRDKTGIVQLTFDDVTARDQFEKAKSVRSEYVLMAKGTVRKRESINTEIQTGQVEVFVSDLRILAKAQTPPFHITDDTKVNEEIALKYRYLDLRRKKLQQNLFMRHNIARVAREYFYENDFTEIETPMMIKSTPEGARDYLVPSRVHNGKFYALPQSPQMYKQLLMIAGFDRYIQLARCFRDEDLRADRQPEFTQIDIEMSFVDVDDILEMIEGFAKRLFKEVLNVDIKTPILRMTYDEAMSRYGSDKPDTRFDMQIKVVSDLVANSNFSVFSDVIANGGSVRAIVAKNAAQKLTRKEIDKLTEYVRGIGASGMAYVRWTSESKMCSFAKFVSDDELDSILNRIDCNQGDVAFFIADKNKVTLPVLGSLRLTVAKKLEIIPDTFNFLWITEFPFFEFDEDTQTFVAMHHPFTLPTDEGLELLDSDPGAVKAKAYDLVLNGTELCSGSMRITDFELQQKMFAALGLTAEEIEAKFGFLVNAYRY